jgi:ribosomal-protein-alanine N-acetyltransferase
MTPVIEPLDAVTDLDALLEVERASFTNPWTRDMFTWELENSDVSHIYVARTEAFRVAAYCSFWLIFDELHINNLAVRPECRGHGIARAILHHVLEEGARLGARRATLEVRRSNTAALGLYAAEGFQVSGTRRRYYRHPDEDALILWKEGLSADIQ